MTEKVPNAIDAMLDEKRAARERPRARVTYGDGQEFREVENYTETVNEDGSVDISWDPVPGVTAFIVTMYSDGDGPDV